MSVVSCVKFCKENDNDNDSSVEKTCIYIYVRATEESCGLTSTNVGLWRGVGINDTNNNNYYL